MKLLTDPDYFLKYYPVKCEGSAVPNPNGVNLLQYYINKQGVGEARFPNEKLGHKGATRPGSISGYKHEISSFILNPRTSAGSAIIAAHVVPMVNYNSTDFGCPNLNANIAAMDHYTLDNTGDGLMVTGELSGCCFCWLLHGHELWCVHVRPIAGISSESLQAQLNATGRFNNDLTALNTYGKNDYNNQNASVIGVRSGGVWKIYAQTSNDLFRTISGAYRLYPDRIRL